MENKKVVINGKVIKIPLYWENEFIKLTNFEVMRVMLEHNITPPVVFHNDTLDNYDSAIKVLQKYINESEEIASMTEEQKHKEQLQAKKIADLFRDSNEKTKAIIKEREEKYKNIRLVD